MSIINRKSAKGLALALAPLVFQNARAASKSGKSPKVMGAEPVPTDLNYVVQLDVGFGNSCTGTLIGPEHILAAASCFLDDWGDISWDTSMLTVRDHLSRPSVGLGRHDGQDCSLRPGRVRPRASSNVQGVLQWKHCRGPYPVAL